MLKFTIGIDEEKTLTLTTPQDITGTYYAIVYDPILDAFPFASIDDMVKNHLKSPILNRADWTTHNDIGNPAVSSQSWQVDNYITPAARTLPGTPSIVNTTEWSAYISPFFDKSSEIKTTVLVPSYLQASLRKGKLSLRFGATLNKSQSPQKFYDGKIKISSNSFSEEFSLKFTPRSRASTARAAAIGRPEIVLSDSLRTLINRMGGTYNLFRTALPSNATVFNFHLQGLKDPTHNSTHSGHKHLQFSNVYLYFEHRQMMQYPEIKTT